MQYENRQPREGVNVSRVHPLTLFAQLVFGALVVVVLMVVVLQVSGGWLAKRIPFGFEIAVMEALDEELGNNEDYPQMSKYLNDLAGRVVGAMNLPDDMQITVHYNDENVFNAFATMGGNVMFYKGLLKDMPDENTLAMVMSHEIAHVLHRDPVAGLGGGVASTIALLAMTGSVGYNMAGSVLTNAGVITRVQFSRGMEEAADEAALAAVHNLYGHVNGATALFELFGEERGPQARTSQVLDKFLSTHPRDKDRVADVQKRAQAQGWSLDGELTPLPEGYKQWF